MSFLSTLFGGPTVVTKPGDSALEGDISQLNNWNQGLGKAGKIAKQGLAGFASGNYDNGVFGSMLNPIRDQYATSQREMDREATMGGNALGGAGTSKPLMDALELNARNTNTQNEGLALGQAVPALYGQLSGTFQNALNAKNQGNLQAREAGTAAQGQYYGQRYGVAQQPGILGTLAGLGTSAFGGPTGGIAAGIGKLFGGQPSTGTDPSICWIAQALYGDADWRVGVLRKWLVEVWARESVAGAVLVAFYRRFGERAARVVKSNRMAYGIARMIFNRLLRKAQHETR